VYDARVRRALAVTVAILTILTLVVRVRYAPPSPVGRDAKPESFSAERGRDVQRLVVGDGAPRPVGSEANARARRAIADALGRAGLRVETQSTLSCSHHGFCAHVSNVIGVLEGRDASLAADAIVLSAHYDSVAVSPGASDDGVGTAAVVEAARALAAGPRPRHTTIVLLTDGEEDGLLGAEAFVAESPYAKRARAAINVDARGSRGPSQMFETSPGNTWLVDTMGRGLVRPVTSSLFYEVYRRMPNDTDFTSIKRIAEGVNFANTAGLGMARAFDEAALGQGHARKGDAVWFDVLALGIVRWPRDWTLPMAIVAFVLAAAQALALRARDRGLFVFPAMLLSGGVAVIAVGTSLHLLSAAPAPWIAHPLPAEIAIHFASIASAAAAAITIARHASPRALWSSTWLGWGLCGIGAATTAPGAAYLFIVPTFAAALLPSISFEAACIVGAGVAAIFLFPIAASLYEALGFVLPAAIGAPTVLFVTTLAPLLVGTPRRGPIVLGASAAVAVVVAALVPAFSSETPQRVNVVFRQGETGDARVFVDTAWGPAGWGPPPDAMVRALGDRSRLVRESPLPWSLPAVGVDVPSIATPLPEAVVVASETSGGRRRVRLRVRSPRGATTLALVLPQGRAIEVTVEGKRAQPRWGYVVGLKAGPPEGFEVALDANGSEPIPVTLLDRDSGLPPGSLAASAARARPKEATPTQDGDVTVVSRSLSL
jgi:peptidase M28-like protein